MSGTTFDFASRVQVALTASGQPAIAVLVPGIQGPSGTELEEIALNKLAPGALPASITVASANIVDGTIVNADINAAAGIVDTKLATIATAGKVANSATTATADNTASAIVARNASGNFTANVITADLAGKSDSTDQLENGLTFNDSGTGIASGSEFDGVAALTVSYNSVGAASAGHSHANLIFVPAGADDTALAAAFADAAANDKKIIFSEDTTVKIPSVAPTIQAACTLVEPTVDVTVLIQSGYTINNINILRNRDYSRFRITSEDAEVLVGVDLTQAAGITPGGSSGVVRCETSTAPVWDFVLDCDGKADYGLHLINSRTTVLALKGVKRSKLANFFVRDGSHISATTVNVGGTIYGMVASDGLRHGIWVTWNSSAACPYSDFSNCGGDGSTDGYGAFVSRATTCQFDESNFQGCSRGIRNARSLVTARGSNFNNVIFQSVNQSDGGITTITGATLDGSGGGGSRWVLIATTGIIVANDCRFDEAQGVLAYMTGPDARISMNGCSGVNITNSIGEVGHGELYCLDCQFSVDPVNWDVTKTQLFTANAGSRVHVFGGTYDGGGVVLRPGRAVADAALSFDRLTTTGFVENRIALRSEAATIYAQGSTHNGSANVMDRGSDARGEFVRRADGSMECWAWLEVTTIDNNKRMSRVWNLPEIFAISAGTVSVTATLSRRNPSNVEVTTTSSKLKDCQLTINAHDTTLCGFFIEINSSAATTFVTGDTIWIRAHAIGRWF